MTHGSLFSGIGGFDLAAQWAGWTNHLQIEIEPWCQRILKKNFPNVPHRHDDIRTFDPAPFAHTIDVLSGGFPCQPYSQAGQRKGKDDPRHLWPEMLRIIRVIQPRWVVGENVRGLVNWSHGLVFHEVCADLESAGYSVQPYILPAASVNAPHQRQRVWFIAHSGRNRLEGRDNQAGQSKFEATITPVSTLVENKNWHQHTKSFIYGANDGIPHRVDRIRGLGNAVVPQLVWRIFDTINQYEALMS